MGKDKSICSNCFKECDAKASTDVLLGSTHKAVSMCCEAKIIQDTREVIESCSVCGHRHFKEKEKWLEAGMKFYQYIIMTDEGEKELLCCPKCGVVKIKKH